MNIAYTMSDGAGATDLLIAEVAKRAMAIGLKTAGTIQINAETASEGACDMNVVVLPDGPSITISQSLGRASKGCRLDAASLEAAVGLVAKNLHSGPDVLIINKFGSLESEGRGFREVIAEAIARDIPVLVGLNKMYAKSFSEFTDGVAVQLPPNPEKLINWIATTATAAHAD